MTTRRQIAWTVAAVLVGFMIASPSSATPPAPTAPCLNGGTAVVGEIPGCWFLSDAGQSCTDVCGSKGLVYDEKTRTVAGSDGSMDACMTLQMVLGAFVPPCLPIECGDGLGCSYNVKTQIPSQCMVPPTTADAATVDIERVCACMPGAAAPALSSTGLTLAAMLLLGGGAWMVRRRVTD